MKEPKLNDLILGDMTTLLRDIPVTGVFVKATADEVGVINRSGKYVAVPREDARVLWHDTSFIELYDFLMLIYENSKADVGLIYLLKIGSYDDIYMARQKLEYLNSHLKPTYLVKKLKKHIKDLLDVVPPPEFKKFPLEHLAEWIDQPLEPSSPEPIYQVHDVVAVKFVKEEYVKKMMVKQVLFDPKPQYIVVDDTNSPNFVTSDRLLGLWHYAPQKGDFVYAKVPADSPYTEVGLSEVIHATILKVEKNGNLILGMLLHDKSVGMIYMGMNPSCITAYSREDK